MKTASLTERGLDMKMDYVRDITSVQKKVVDKYGTLYGLDDIVKKIIGLHKTGVLNINHSVLEIILAAHLLNQGFKVYAEVEVAGGIVDIYAIKGIDISIEVETGYVPPTNAISAEEFLMGRLALKTARYSNVGHEFYIAVPSFYIPPIPEPLLIPPEERKEDDIRKVMFLIRKYSKSPDVTLDDVKTSKINGIITINTKTLDVKVIDIKNFSTLKHFYSQV
jgi:hypothetical protein